MPERVADFPQAVKVAKASARAAPSVTVRSSVTTSRASPSPPSVVSPVVVVSSVSPPVCSSALLSPPAPTSRSLDPAISKILLTFYHSDLRRDPRRSKDLPRRCHSRRSHLHRARQAQDRYELGCRVCIEAPGPYALWFWWIGCPISGSRHVVIVGLGAG